MSFTKLDILYWIKVSDEISSCIFKFSFLKVIKVFHQSTEMIKFYFVRSSPTSLNVLKIFKKSHLNANENLLPENFSKNITNFLIKITVDDFVRKMERKTTEWWIELFTWTLPCDIKSNLDDFFFKICP